MFSSNICFCISIRSPSAPAQSGSMPTGTRPIGRSTASNSASVASVSNDSDTTFDDGSLQHQRLATFAAQNRLEDGTPYGRLQDTMTATTAAANKDGRARDAFYQARATENIREFDNAFNSNK
ncbi:hypothetical protein QBC32DRAFT_213919 [Pseudoneurospora amorphoporcata]|uniref:Uncharacterized protein n=1 Tax=Pseudoneurospora amorphoporcata TaxID=241081 RepID=A0AAN6NVN3_9PEZI|nr:hypothetical protein QBC32DRAFT_213919 [Pseudoneurospora amorphoporcata]